MYLERSAARGAPLSSEQCPHPVDHAVQDPRNGSVKQDGPRDGKDLGPHAQHKPLRAAVDGGRHHSVGKARNGHQRARARHLCQTIKHAEIGEDALSPFLNAGVIEPCPSVSPAQVETYLRVGVISPL